MHFLVFVEVFILNISRTYQKVYYISYYDVRLNEETFCMHSLGVSSFFIAVSVLVKILDNHINFLVALSLHLVVCGLLLMTIELGLY